jgi:hypothetical protein
MQKVRKIGHSMGFAGSLIMSSLVKESETYKRLLPSLLTEEGKYAVIHEDKLIGVFASYEDALKIGYHQCGINPFLVKRISAEESISYFSRDLSYTCHA